METLLNMNTRPTAVNFPHGVALLRDPLLNKGTAFSEKERDAFGLRGLLPAHLLSQEQQVARILTNLRRLPDDLDKYVDRCFCRDWYRRMTEHQNIEPGRAG